MGRPALKTCRACHRALAYDPHRPDCPALRAIDIAPPARRTPPAWKVTRVARDARGRALEEKLEACNLKARAWLKARGRAFP